MNYCLIFVSCKSVDMERLLFLGGLQIGEIVIIALVILLLFGGRKIPELMKGLGKGVRSFKEGINEVDKDLNTPVETGKKDTEQKEDRK